MLPRRILTATVAAASYYDYLSSYYDYAEQYQDYDDDYYDGQRRAGFWRF